MKLPANTSVTHSPCRDGKQMSDWRDRRKPSRELKLPGLQKLSSNQLSHCLCQLWPAVTTRQLLHQRWWQLPGRCPDNPKMVISTKHRCPGSLVLGLSCCASASEPIFPNPCSADYFSSFCSEKVPNWVIYQIHTLLPTRPRETAVMSCLPSNKRIGIHRFSLFGFSLNQNLHPDPSALKNTFKQN